MVRTKYKFLFNFFCTTESYNWSLAESYNKSGTFWIYGDSLGRNFYDSVVNHRLCKELYAGCQLSYNGIYLKERNKTDIKFDDFDFRPQIVVENILYVLRKPEMQREDSVLFLHIGLHFPVSINFTTYQNLIDDIISNLTDTEVNSQGQTVPKYKAKVIWKSSAAVHHGKTSNFLTSQVRSNLDVLNLNSQPLLATTSRKRKQPVSDQFVNNRFVSKTLS